MSGFIRMQGMLIFVDSLPALRRATTCSLVAPHIAEELWIELGHEAGIMNADWPVVNEEALKRDEIEMVVRVNGKGRDKIKIASTAPQDEIEDAALAAGKVQQWFEGKTVRKVIVVPGRLVNIAVS